MISRHYRPTAYGLRPAAGSATLRRSGRSLEKTIYRPSGENTGSRR